MVYIGVTNYVIFTKLFRKVFPAVIIHYVAGALQSLINVILPKR